MQNFNMISEKNPITEKFTEWYNKITKNATGFDLEIFYSSSEGLIELEEF